MSWSLKNKNNVHGAAPLSLLLSISFLLDPTPPHRLLFQLVFFIKLLCFSVQFGLSDYDYGLINSMIISQIMPKKQNHMFDSHLLLRIVIVWQ